MNLLILTNTAQVGNYGIFFKAIEKLDHNLLGFVSLDNQRIFEKINGYTIYPMDHLKFLKYDILLLNSGVGAAQKIFFPAFEKMNIPLQKVHTASWLLQQLMIKKYEDVDDSAIQETLNYWKMPNELTIFNQHVEKYPHTFDEMHIDETCGLPYIIFKTVEGKDRRMYFPRNGGQRVKGADGKIYIVDILREQVPTSPHLYITDEHKINDGDILIDAGVCEGNFSLKYVDVCSKVYLFEMDKNWWEPLYYSFRDCLDKVEFVHKACSDVTSGGGAASIDDVVHVPKNSNIFIKMDIEGAEPAALHGAKNILQNYNVKASICSYHNFDDAVKIKSIFQNYGYKTRTSAGYMVYILDPNIWNTADFRKGIVYAENY